MDDKLESFVTLLNKQRQLRPAAPEPVRAPSWTERLFSKRADAPVAPVRAPVPESNEDTAGESALAVMPIVPEAAAPDVAIAETVAVAPSDVAPAIAETPAAAEETHIFAAPHDPAPDAAAIADASAVVAEQSVSVEAPAEVPAAEPVAEPIAEQRAPLDATEAAPPAWETVAALPAEVPTAVALVEAAAPVEAPTPPQDIVAASEEAAHEAAAEIVPVAALDPIVASIAEAAAIAEETVPPVEAALGAAIAPPEIVAAASAELAPEAAAEIAPVAALDPIVDSIAEAAAIADETVPAVGDAIAPPEIVAATSAKLAPEATAEIVPVAALDLVAEPVAEAPAFSEEAAAPVEAQAEPVLPEAVLAAASAEAAAVEATPEIATIAAAEPGAVPIAEQPAFAEEAAAPVAASATPVAEIIADGEAAPTAALPEVPAAPAIPEAASPLIAAIFARIARPDTVSIAIAETATAAVRPPDAPADAEAGAREADAVPPEPVADALRDPHDLLARFLAETDLDVAPAPERVLAEAAAKLDEVLQAVAADATAIRRDDDALAAESDEDGPAVPLPVMAEQVAAARASRGYLRYGLTAVAVVAGVVVVGGAYWSTQAPWTNLAGGGDTARSPAPAMTAMNVVPPPRVVPPPASPATARPAAPKLAVTATADGAVRVPSGAASAAAAAILATLPPVKSGGGLAIVEAKPAPPTPGRGSATALAQAPRQLAMLTPPPPEPPPTPVTSSMVAPAPPAPPAPVAVVPSGPEPAWERNAVPAPPYSGKPQIAIVIDDLGIDHDRTERSVGLTSAVTLSFLAYASDLPVQTDAARRAGHELIVHVPMEPAIRPKYVSQGAGGEAQAELLRRLRWDLSRFTGYVGVNNHMGSRLSADPRAMRTVIGELKARGLLFLDSRLDGNAIDVAQHEGVAAVGRDVLLDDDITAGSVADRLAQVEKVARQHGTAIALGHPHDQTINALKLWIASLPAKGLQLVPLSAIVKDRAHHVAAAGGGG